MPITPPPQPSPYGGGSTHFASVDEHFAGLRLDKFLSLALPQLSRARVQQIIEAGGVSRAGKTLTSVTGKVKLGETYALLEPETVALDLTPSSIALDVVYEDAEFLVINKPVGMTVHPAAGTRGDTLVHALLAHCGDSLSGIGGVARPGIVHRIDKETSGLLVVAKNDAAHQSLSTQLQARTLKRHYVAFTWMALNPRDGEIEAPLARHPRHRRQMAVIENGRYALTHYTTDATYHAPGSITPLASKIHCELDTGRTHQIRVHMMHAKCPLVGDPVYGATTATRLNRLKAGGTRVPEEVAAVLQMLNRQALHAAELRLTHPKTGEFMEFSCPLPPDLQALENALATLTFHA
ncbi:MAG: RluA family pseudouridine synthase [Rickettsiales bacterium]